MFILKIFYSDYISSFILIIFLVVEGKHHDAPWGERNHHGCRKGKQANYHRSHYDIHGGSALEEEVCAMLPDDGMAYTHTLCNLMDEKLRNKRDVVTIHIGLGPCSALLDQDGMYLKVNVIIHINL